MPWGRNSPISSLAVSRVSSSATFAGLSGLRRSHAYLNLGEGLFVTDTFQAAFNWRFFAPYSSLDRFPRYRRKPMPHRWRAHDFIPLRKRNHAHQLREVGVRRRTDQQPAWLPACLLCERPKPGPSAVARSERAVFAKIAACAMLRSALPHSHRTQTSVRSPLVPRSSMNNWRCLFAQSEGPLCAKAYQSMSAMWPARQARTNRTGTTGRRFLSRSMNLPFVSAFRWTSRRVRKRALSLPPDPA